MKIKICYIISFIDFSQQFVDIDHILYPDKYELSYIFLSATPPLLKKIFDQNGRATRFVQYESRKDLPGAVFQIYKYLGQIKPDIVHTHLVDASLAGLVAARLRNIKNRVHTRHHSIENYVYYPHGAYYDKLINYLSRRIIAISSVVANVLIDRENVPQQKISVVEHGFKFEDYNYSPEKVKELKAKYGLSGAYPVIGAISRFVEWKGVQFIVPAFKQLKAIYPEAKLVLANARGNYTDEVKRILKENLNESDYVLIEFEKNFVELYKMFDVFVHVPINKEFEAFGQTYIESLALEIPSVFTLSGIANDFIVNNKNAIVVPYENSEAIYNAIKLLLEDENLCANLVRQARVDVSVRFDIQNQMRKLTELYNNL